MLTFSYIDCQKKKLILSATKNPFNHIAQTPV